MSFVINRRRGKKKSTHGIPDGLPSAAAQPSAALRAMEGILRTLRCTPLFFACAKKNPRMAFLTACHP